MHRALVIALSFSLSGSLARTAVAAPRGWKRPQAPEHALRATLAETKAAHAALQPKLSTASAHYQKERSVWQQLSDRRNELLDAADDHAKYPLLPWRREGLTRAAWHARTGGWLEKAATMVTEINGAATKTNAAHAHVQHIGAEMDQLKKSAAQVDEQLFEHELARAPQSLVTPYKHALGAEEGVRTWSSATWTELREFNARQHPEPDYYDYAGRAIVDGQMNRAGNAVYAAEAKVAAAKKQIREGAAK